ncbi:signal transduction histidine kinase [Allocatelliglobosispora scoriae]|uniref:histidine kinase n=1 Tax=Allocatelliglobosispora scoriae TaxID=643052 RepID=A0A841C0T6_9ACTN|nr:sensor histidine kinase [Allocatelliglobosispora scoriae]MBB5873466.1 signal transduction histidine kinase [Allocatelliglobosispora scoriae]
MRWRADAAGWPPLAAAVLGAAAAIQAAARMDERSELTVAGTLLALGMTAPVALAGLWPIAAAALGALATLLCLLTVTPPTVGGVVAVGVLFAVAGRRRPARLVFPLLLPFLCWLFLLIGIVPIGGVLSADDLAAGRRVAGGLLGVMAVAAAAGTAWRVRAETRRRDAAAQAAQESLLAHVARGERATIARELHDVVAHHISMIALLADTARLTTAGMPPEGAQRLVTIGDTARTALTEMRRLLGVLREDAEPATAPVRQPQPGLRQLNDLLDEARSVGSGSARLIVSGAVAPLDQGIELTAYRIVQEALTNARRHAAGAAVDVELHYRADALLIRVRDNGPGPTRQDSGHGLAGMRERAAMAGGTVATGAGPMGGFVVEALLPTGAAS